MLAIGEAGIRPMVGIRLSAASSSSLAPMKRLLSARRPRRLFLSVGAGVDYGAVIAPVHKSLDAIAARYKIPLVWLPDLVEVVASVSRASSARTRRLPWWRIRGGRGSRSL